jgi:hypothetical protein
MDRTAAFAELRRYLAGRAWAETGARDPKPGNRVSEISHCGTI